jgi:hypothetical protein
MRNRTEVLISHYPLADFKNLEKKKDTGKKRARLRYEPSFKYAPLKIPVPARPFETFE